MSDKSFTSDDGYTLRAFPTMYLDWGVELTKGGKTIHYSPSGLSVESFGFHWEDDDGNELDEGRPWTDEEWKAALESELDTFVDCFDQA